LKSPAERGFFWSVVFGLWFLLTGFCSPVFA
jgi:hypothetical protein